MPRISHFHGISIYMYYRDHAPPHFHAIQADSEATVEIATATILDGKLSSKSWAMVREWTQRRRDELEEDWRLARGGQPLRPISPL